jgi:hypothetical protein
MALSERLESESQYGDWIKDQICNRLMAGESLNQICKTEGFPPESTVRTWVYRETDPEFCANYARAREIQTERFADELIALADSKQGDIEIVVNEDGSTYERVNREVIERNRLQIDTRKWVISKILPKKYGDKLNLEHSGTVNHTANPAEFLSTGTLEAIERELSISASNEPILNAEAVDVE